MYFSFFSRLFIVSISLNISMRCDRIEKRPQQNSKSLIVLFCIHYFFCMFLFLWITIVLYIQSICIVALQYCGGIYSFICAL